MRRVSQTSMLLLVVALAVLWLVAAVDAGQKGAAKEGAPQPTGRFQVMTTSISPNMGVSWADGRFSFKNQNYRFRVEAETMGDPQMLTTLAGQQLVVEGDVYNLKDVSDFAGTYTRVKPEVVKAMGGSDRHGVFQNDKGVVLRVTRRIQMDPSMYVRLLGDSFKITMREF
jgi:hypothetical protein